MRKTPIAFARRLTVAMLLVLVCLMPARAGDEHAHHAASDEPELQLNNGEKWASDKALRQAMNAIRAVVNRNLYSVHTGRADTTAYEYMANEVEAEVHYMVENCALPPAADAELHKLIAMLGAAVEEMRAGPDRKAGVIRVVRALNLYGRYFSHEGWAPERD